MPRPVCGLASARPLGTVDSPSVVKAADVLRAHHSTTARPLQPPGPAGSVASTAPCGEHGGILVQPLGPTRLPSRPLLGSAKSAPRQVAPCLFAVLTMDSSRSYPPPAALRPRPPAGSP